MVELAAEVEAREKMKTTMAKMQGKLRSMKADKEASLLKAEAQAVRIEQLEEGLAAAMLESGYGFGRWGGAEMDSSFRSNAANPFYGSSEEGMHEFYYVCS